MADSNFLKLIPAKTRRTIYLVYSLIGLIIGAIQAGLGAVNTATPDWLKITLAVYAFLGTAIGLTAFSNVGNVGNADQGATPAPAPAPGT